MKIVLVRHGLSEGNKKGIFTGWSDVALSEDGIADLEKYKSEYHYPETDRYYASDLIRAVDTFDILFGDKKILHEQSKELRELFFGDLEDVKVSTFPLSFSETWSRNERHENWETRSEFEYRVVSKLEQIVWDLKKEKKTSATIVCHSGVIKTLLISLANLPYIDFQVLGTPNGLGYILHMDHNESTNQLVLKEYEEITKK